MEHVTKTPCKHCGYTRVKFDGLGTKRIICGSCDAWFDVLSVGASWVRDALDMWDKENCRQPLAEGGQSGSEALAGSYSSGGVGRCALVNTKDQTKEQLIPHPQADVLRAIADGKPVQFKRFAPDAWIDFDKKIHAVHLVSLYTNEFFWQIKPEKPRVETGIFVHGDDIRDLRDVSYKLTIDPVTDRVIRLELVK